MYKQLSSLVVAGGLVLTLNACSADEPSPPRDKKSVVESNSIEAATDSGTNNQSNESNRRVTEDMTHTALYGLPAEGCPREAADELPIADIGESQYAELRAVLNNKEATQGMYLSTAGPMLAVPDEIFDLVRALSPKVNQEDVQTYRLSGQTADFVIEQLPGGLDSVFDHLFIESHELYVTTTNCLVEVER